jgi:hypothetical protein
MLAVPKLAWLQGFIKVTIRGWQHYEHLCKRDD